MSKTNVAREVSEIASRALVAERLRNQRLEGPPLERSTDVVRHLVASQAQDFAGAKWALGLRAKAARDAGVEGEFDEGAFLRTHVMRPTWHFVAQEDIRWLLALTASRVHAFNASRYRELRLDGATLRKATAAIAKSLERAPPRTREELRDVLAHARIEADGQRMAYILMHAELEAIICSGPRRGKQFTYSLLEERAPRARSLSREDALVELAGRYFASRGPATVQDLAKWSGLTVTEARAGLEAVASKLRSEVVGGATYWRSPAEAHPSRRKHRAHLLSIYDEYISAYRDRSALCAPAYAKRLVGMGNALAYVVIVDGQLAGTWRRTFTKQTAHVEVTAFRKLAEGERRAVVAAAERFTRFLGDEHELQLEIR